jgi:hypothetical protein
MHLTISTRIRLISALTVLGILAGVAGLILSPGPRAVSAQSGGNVTVSFEKYVTTFPAMAGTVVCGDDTAGVFAGTINDFSPTPGGHIFHIDATYGFICADSDFSFTAHVSVTQNNQTHRAALNGVVTDGWLKGAQVHGEFQVVSGPCPGGTCIPGTLRIMLGSAH